MIRLAAIAVAINSHYLSHWMLFRIILAAGSCFLLLGSGLLFPAMAKERGTAEELLNEQRWIEERKQDRNLPSKAGNSNKLQLAASRYEIRCTKLKGQIALKACNEGLAEFPENAFLYRGKGDALMELSRYGKALKAYKKVQVYSPGDNLSKRGIVKAKSLIRVNKKKCLQLKGQIALESCRSALIKGGKNEFVIRQRMGHLYKEAGQRTKAISAYQAALALDKSNATVLAELQSLGGKTTEEQKKTSSIKEVVVQTAPQPKLATPSQQIKQIQQKSILKVPVKTESPPDQITVTEKAAVPEQTIPVQAVLLKEPEPTKPDDEKPSRYSNAPLPSGFTY